MPRGFDRDQYDVEAAVERVATRHPQVRQDRTGNEFQLTGPTGGSSGGGGGSSAPAARPPQPDCGGSSSEWVTMPVEAGYPSGGYWRCTGPPTYGYGGRPLGGGGGGMDPGSFNYQTPAYRGPSRPQYNIGPAPEFMAPGFNAPTADSIYADPSYKFRLGQGLGALEASAAARGVLRSGGTLQGVQDYAQDYASQEYGNIFNRALQDYDRKYQAAFDEFRPRFDEWQTRTGADVGAGNLAFQAALDRYFFNINDQFRNKELVFNAGLG